MGPLVKERIVVLVTHCIKLILSAAAYVVRPMYGRVQFSGMLEEFRSSEALGNLLLDEQVYECGESEVVEAEVEEGGTVGRTANRIRTASHASTPVSEESDSKKTEPRKLVKDEARAEGHVKAGIYKVYIKAS